MVSHLKYQRWSQNESATSITQHTTDHPQAHKPETVMPVSNIPTLEPVRLFPEGIDSARKKPFYSLPFLTYFSGDHFFHHERRVYQVGVTYTPYSYVLDLPENTVDGMAGKFAEPPLPPRPSRASLFGGLWYGVSLPTKPVSLSHRPSKDTIPEVLGGLKLENTEFEFKVSAGRWPPKDSTQHRSSSNFPSSSSKPEQLQSIIDSRQSPVNDSWLGKWLATPLTSLILPSYHGLYQATTLKKAAGSTDKTREPELELAGEAILGEMKDATAKNHASLGKAVGATTPSKGFLFVNKPKAKDLVGRRRALRASTKKIADFRDQSARVAPKSSLFLPTPPPKPSSPCCQNQEASLSSLVQAFSKL